MQQSCVRFVSVAVCLVLSVVAVSAEAVLSVEPVEEGGFSLRVGDEAPFHVTPNAVSAPRFFRVPGAGDRVARWTETDADGIDVPYYALGLGGAPLGEGRPTSYRLKLRHGEFDPAADAPAVEPGLAAKPGENLWLVQFETQPLESYREALGSLGGAVRGFIPGHAHIVESSAAARARVEALEFVRWVGPYHPAYRLEEVLRVPVEQLRARFPEQRYSILAFGAGEEYLDGLIKRLDSLGSKVRATKAGKHLLDATLTPEQLLAVVRWDEISFIDRWSPLEPDMDIVREQGGANYLETVAGYTGVGVRGESFDTGFNVNHPDFASRPPIQHGGAVGNDSHGTACLGICFGDGTGDARALGLMPDGQPICADYNNIGLTGTTRYDHTGELLQPPYEAVFQTASVGSSRTTQYTTISADHDTLLFDWQVLHCQSQSNAGNQNSRPQAWAKNIVSGGAFNHYNTPDKGDDCWCSTGSIGPAADGRIKPDLSFFYDDTYTTYTTGNGYGEFGGTSGATPSICGHFGLFFQMWSDGIFGNDVTPGATVFENRPHMTTAKAFMINTAEQYAFTGQSHDMTRVHQGWGVPSVRNLYDLRNDVSFIDESVVLTNTESVEFNAFVDPGTPAMRVTMTYVDPAGSPAASQHRINDLSVKVTSPSGTVYHGNVGLLDGNWSQPGGAPNTYDTVENVFVQNPEDGLWIIEVTAAELVQDSHVETPELDADFALVVSGAFMTPCTSDGTVTLDRSKYACEDSATVRVVDCDLNLDDNTIETHTVTIDSTTESGVETVLLTETGPGSATFIGSIPVSETNAAGTLHVAEGDTVTATYVDSDDGKGGTNLTKTDQAVVDCTAPVISNVQTTDVGPRSATVTFDTDEPARGTVRYGLSCAVLDLTSGGSGFITSHSITLGSLADSTTYFYAVDAEDEVGNASTDDNGGSCYSFTTPAVPDFFTEEFASDNDSDFLSVSFVPDGSFDYYTTCSDTISALPTDPTGGTPISLSDDSSQAITLTGGATVSLYGVDYSTFYVGSNGYITFTAGDSDYTESLTDHFDLPRISALFDDLNPASGGTISWQQLADRAVVTYQGLPEYSTSNSNTFQVEMFFNGTITLSFLDVAATDGIMGLSQSGGVPPDFFETDLSSSSSCFLTVPGEAGSSTMMTVTGYDEQTGELTLSFGVPCAATGHVIEYGQLTRADLESYNWSGQECGVDASGVHTWNLAGTPESMFFVVVGHNGTEEGSYGRHSDGTERTDDSWSLSCPYVQDLPNACQ